MKKTANSGMVFVSVLVLLALAGSVWALEDSNLVSHWRFDEGEGDTAYDSAGNNDGTIYGAQWVDGIIDGALDFDGVDDYVDCGNTFASVTGSTTKTITAWAKSDTADYSGQADGNGRIITLYRESGYSGFSMLAKGSLATWQGLYATAGNYYNYIDSGVAIVADTSTHIALVQDGAGVYIYINGVLANSSTDAAAPTMRRLVNADIGSYWGGYSSFFNGRIDDVRIYNRALSEEEIEQLYQDGLPDLVAIDIKPQSCPNPLNLKSRGVLPVAVLGSEDFDVNNIDVASIRLADVAPIRSSFDDVATPVADGNECECTTEGPDGYTDLTLKFKTQEIVEKFINAPNELVGGLTLSLTLTGALSDGTLIEGTDCVLLVGNVPRAIAAKRADINGDGVVDFRDLTIVANYWLESSEIE